MSCSELESRIDRLSEEIRGYPTPIARCDEQLSALIEERAELMKKLEGLQEPTSCSPAALWVNDGGFDAA